MFDFPNAPTLGQRYPASPVAGLPQYSWDGEKWAAPGQPSSFADAPSDGYLYGRRNAAWSATDARQQIGQCKLIYTSATAITLMPCNGNSLKINGVINQVPSAGVALSNAGMAASTIYYIYAWMNAGTMQLEASTTSYISSSATGNIGTMTKSGDNTRTLVGMIATNISSQFLDLINYRLVRSWFNDFGITAFGASASVLSGFGSTTPVELDGAAAALTLLWAGEEWSATVNLQGAPTSATLIIIYAVVWLNSGPPTFYSPGTYGGAALSAHGCSVGVASGVAVEGYNRFSIAAYMSSGQATLAQKGVTVATVRK